MRLGQARRFSEFLYRKGRSEIDFVTFVLSYFKVKFVQSGRYYICSFKSGWGWQIRRHRCAFKLCLLVYRAMSKTTDQGTRIVLGDCVIPDAARQKLKFKIVRTPYDVQPNRRLQKPKPEPEVQHAINQVRESLPEELLFKIDEYQHASCVSDPVQRVEGEIKLGLKPPKEGNYRLEFMQFVTHVLNAPRKNGKLIKAEVDLSVERQFEVPASSSNAGYVPTVKTANIDKRTGKNAAIAINERDRRLGGIPPCIPHKTFYKDEVLKKGKNPRAIQIQSQPDYILDSLADRGFTSMMLGHALGAKTLDGGFKQLFITWFLQYRTATGAGWDSFIEFLKSEGAHESDKTGWESSTNKDDCMAFVTAYLATLNIQHQDRSIFARALAGYINPLICLGKHGFFASFRVPSGTQRTSYGNTRRHSAMNVMVVDIIDCVNNGPLDCTCPYCTIIEYDTSVIFNNLNIKLKRLAMILGDDYLSVSCGKEQDAKFDSIMDRLCGTETRTVTVPFFKEPKGFDDEGSCEFLRKSFYVDHQNNIRTYRKSARVLAKLFYGRPTTNKALWSQSVLSARYEAGCHPALQNVLLQLQNVKNDYECDEKLIDRKKRGTPQVSDVPDPLLFYWKDAANREGGFLDPLVRAIMDNHLYRKYGMSLDEYNA